MPDYSKGVIYTIKTGECVYVGSTCNFTNRKWQHKKYIYYENSAKYNTKLYKTIRENGGEWDIKPYKEFSCETKLQLEIEEEKIRRELNADLNGQRCCIFKEKEYVPFSNNEKEYNKAYRKKFAEELKEKKKEYRENNKKKIKEQKKKSYIKNKEKHDAYMKNYREQHKEKQKAYMKEYYQLKRLEKTKNENE